jgi:mRNA interferase MazF
VVKRGDISWLDLEVEGRRPVCVLTRDEAIPALRNVVVATITKNVRGAISEVPLGPDDGLPRECVIALDNLRTVPKAQLTEPIVTLDAARLHDVCRALNAAAGCN